MFPKRVVFEPLIDTNENYHLCLFVVIRGSITYLYGEHSVLEINLNYLRISPRLAPRAQDEFIS